METLPTTIYSFLFFSQNATYSFNARKCKYMCTLIKLGHSKGNAERFTFSCTLLHTSFTPLNINGKKDLSVL